MNRSGTNYPLPQAGADSYDDQSEDNSIRWYHPQASQKLRGIALVIHGLNLRPQKMASIIAMLTESGIDTLLLSLQGHGENFSPLGNMSRSQARMEAFKNVTYPLWRHEAYEAYQQVRRRGDQEQVPLFLIGFSLGGLIGLDLLTSNPDLNFDKMVLFAPSIRIHGTHHAIRLLSPYPRLVIPSLSPKSYLANPKGTPMAAYNAFFEAFKHFGKHITGRINVPTIIFINPRDEIVSLRGLKRLADKEKLDRWKFHIVKKGITDGPGRTHHLIIDESMTGKQVWNEMMYDAIKHLLP
jgi:alpha-beta hydrolase superfamily lysophospholipase